ncbi:condensation domain-containing protein [Phytohabitans aurantiacus]|uniref:Condensation domain-containing protein n=1 Tax=Phytohabitans aurantiacus TaxID=3016789 RepID=A0ABQ5QM53_9ACTN|nr:hypothetical protein [Phytohabitans aurantiacus]GLH95314.1 hypothetical protein Pa4123_05860 [Phytohabitans aurantiacus]
MGDLPYGQRILAWAGGPADPERFVALGGMRLPAPPDPAALRRSLDAALARHPVLGTGPVPLATVDDVWVAAAAGRYPPDARSLLWAYLAGRDLLLVAHHTVADPWSMRLLTRDVLAPRASPAPAYGDRVGTVHERRMARVLPYWRGVLAGAPVLEPMRGGTAELRVVTAIAQEDAVAVARAVRSTPFVVLLAAFAQALDPGPARSDGELLLPVLTYGRERADWDTVGLFMNVLPVRLADRRLGAVHRAFAEAYTHEIPFPVLLDAVPEADGLFGVGGPSLAQFEVIQVPPACGGEPLTVPAGLELGGPVLPVNGLAFWLEPGAGGAYTACVRYRRSYGAAAARDLVRRFTKRWEAICADARGT